LVSMYATQIVSMDMAPTESSTRVTNCDKCSFYFSSVQIQLLSLIDFCLGCASLSFAFFLYKKLKENFTNVHTAWLSWGCIILGIFLLLNSGFCFAMATSESCRCGIYPARLFTVIVAISSATIGITSLAQQSVFDSYIDDQGGDIGLSAANINIIKDWYFIIAYAFIALSAVQGYKLYLFSGFHRRAALLDNEYETLQQEETEAWRRRSAAGQKQREEKYSDLRAYYKNKYRRQEDDNTP